MSQRPPAPARLTTRRRPPSAVLETVVPLALTPRTVARRFQDQLADGARLRPAGEARHDPEALLTPRYRPSHELRLFGTTIYLTDLKFDDALGFLVAFVQCDDARGRPSRSIYPRVFYKDSSLVWRVGSHFIHDEDEYWMGKGDLEVTVRDGHEYAQTLEETTNLPFEIQRSLDLVSRHRKRRRDDEAIPLIVREAPTGRLAPYADFTTPRRRAAERYSIHGDRNVARFTRASDPTSLVFVPGYEPDLAGGAVERWQVESKFFGGRLDKARVLSTNRVVQYLFFSSPTHTWLNPPQALSTELSTYGVRTIDVHVPDELCVPGYEYHSEAASQIPVGFVGEPHPMDSHRSDASAWVGALPVVKAFERALPRWPVSSASSEGAR